MTHDVTQKLHCIYDNVNFDETIYLQVFVTVVDTLCFRFKLNLI